MVLGLRREGNCIVRGIGAFHTQHVAIAVVAEIAHFVRFSPPRVPHHGGVAAEFLDVDAALPSRIFDHAIVIGVEIDAVHFLVDAHRPSLLLLCAAIDLVDIRDAASKP